MARILMIRTRREMASRFVAGISPPLGLMSLAAYARVRRPGKDQFKIVDERLMPCDGQHYARLITSWKPDIIALSSLSVEADRVSELSRVLKATAPEVPIVAGGPYPSASGTRVFESARVDYLVRGEGEGPFVELLDCLDTGGMAREGIPGVCRKDRRGKIVDWGLNPDLADVDSLPIPAWDLVDWASYTREISPEPTPMPGPYAPLFTSRGCPYGCIYCHNIFGKKFRARSAEKVVDEIEYQITEHKIHSFQIFDDIFNLDYGRVMDICAGIKRRKLKTFFSFPNAVRGDILDERLIRELRSVGTYHMAVAVESASPRIQKMIGKNINLKKIKENIEIAARCGIFTWGFFMLGFPTETRQEIWSTISWALKSRLHGANFFLVIPHEGTRLAEMAGVNHAAGPVSLAFDYHFSANSLSKVSARELSMAQSTAFGMFFLDPRRMARIWRSYPTSRLHLLLRAMHLFSIMTIKISGLT